jgi:hypothetical protein
VSSLGRPISTHRGTLGAGGWLWYVGGILILSAFLAVYRFMQVLVLGSPFAQAGDTLGTAALSFAIGTALLVVPVLRWRQSVELCEDGLVWRRMFGSRTLRRDEIAGARMVQHHSRMGSYTEVEVELRAGGSFSIKGVDRPEQLRNAILSWTQA